MGGLVIKRDGQKIVLISCGVFEKEIRLLIKKNRWPIEPHFLCSSLHVNFAALKKHLVRSLDQYTERSKVVFYGTCHPQIDDILEESQSTRTSGQNCIDIILGEKVFTEQLTAGAFFLTEDWAIRWDKIMPLVFGKNEKVCRAIFQESHRFFLAIKTPCSSDYRIQAKEIGERIQLPVHWMDVTLDHMEKTIVQGLKKQIGELK